MSDHLICAIDDSPLSRTSARLAVRLARRLRLDVVLLHAVPAPPPVTPGFPSPAPSDREQLREAALVDAYQLVDDVAREVGLPRGPHRVETGAAAERTCSVAEATSAEMVVVGSRGERGIRSAVLGSVSRAVARQAPCPVVVVPPAAVTRGELLADGREPRGPVVCGLDLDDQRETAVLAARLAEALGTRLVVAHVSRSDDAGVAVALLRAVVDAIAPVLSGGCQVRVLRGDAGAELTALARRERADLVVLGPPRHTAVGAALFGSTATRLATDGATPLVIAR